MEKDFQISLNKNVNKDFIFRCISKIQKINKSLKKLF